MAFDIVLCRNKSEPERLSKDITEIETVTGTLKESTSLIDPVIIVESTIGHVRWCNYLKIEQFGRQYFVNNIKSVRSNLYELSCHVDVLSTYRSEIRKNTAIIKRSQKNYELNFDDGSIKVFNNPVIQTKSFPQGFTTSIEFLLAVAGGSGS